MSAASDIIFAGGGTTACVIAGKLAAADPSLKILVVESGQHSRHVPTHVQPFRYLDHLAPNSTTVTFHVGKPSTHLNGRAPVIPCGRAVGGGSVVNFMFYARGAASDYDDWAALGNKGWSFNEVLPLFKQLETFTPIPGGPTHGYSGPIQISSAGPNLGVGSQFLEVARAYDQARPQRDDIHDFKVANAYGPGYRYVDPITGKRSDAASQYLYPQSANPNLDIVVGKQVKRVVIENGRAVGIEYGGDGETIIANANKLVVVSAGTFGSPSILERSGIGAPSVLEKNNVRVLVDLPGVGEHYQDHVGARPGFYASNDVETLDDVWSDSEVADVWVKEWEERGTGKVAHNGIEALMKFRPTATELASAGLAFKSRWEAAFENRPDKPMAQMAPFAGLRGDHFTTPGQRFLSAIYCLASNQDLYPDMNGHVHITSGDDASSPLDFNPDYFTQTCDIELLTLLYKLTRERVRRMPAYRGEVAAYHPKFPPGSVAACTQTDGPVPIDAPDIVYSAADDEAIVEFHRDTLFTSWHSLGTCAMKPRDLGGVVDARLNVYGVEGLKVADLSICPTNVGNNTYSTALMIGEKATIIIAEDLGIKLPDLEIP